MKLSDLFKRVPHAKRTTRRDRAAEAAVFAQRNSEDRMGRAQDVKMPRMYRPFGK